MSSLPYFSLTLAKDAGADPVLSGTLTVPALTSVKDTS